MQVTTARRGDELLDVPAQLFGARLGGRNALVAEKRAHHAANEPLAHIRRAVEIAPLLPVLHWSLSWSLRRRRRRSTARSGRRAPRACHAALAATCHRSYGGAGGRPRSCWPAGQRA